MATTTIEFQHVKKDFAGKTVIPDMSLKINEGELFVLVGTSGSGKTTSLKMINRLEEPTAGKIIVNGEDTQQTNLQHLRWQIGYVLQQIALFPTMTVAQNIAVIPDMQGTSRKSIDQTIDQLLNEVGLDPKVYRDRLPSELSGGEQQRIGILRALAAQPQIVLMDEPFSALDPISRTQLQDLVLKLHQQYHNTVVFVTHDMDEALKLGDRIGIMSKGELLQVDPPQELAQHPVNQFVADFFATSRAKNLYDVYLDRVGMLQGYLATPADADETNTAELAGDATLRDAFKDLVSQPYIKVVRDHETLGWLDRQQILRFLSQHETA